MIMKKLLCIVLALVSVLALCACTDNGGNTTTTTPTTGDNTPKGYLFTYNNQQIGLNMKMADAQAKIGAETKKNTSDSCAFDGTDTVYYYDSIRITTSDDRGYEWVYEITLLDDVVATQEGIRVGSTADEVVAKYGQSEGGTDALLTYAKDGMKLLFSMKDGKVSAIRYTMV